MRSILRPFRAEPGPLTEPEIEAVHELAASDEDGLRARFVNESLQTPSTIRQMANRAAVGLHAAIGLDERRRAAAERMFAEKLDDVATSPEQRSELARSLAALGNLSPVVQKRTQQVLLDSLNANSDSAMSRALATALIDVMVRLEPAESAPLLAQALGKTSHPEAVHDLALALSAKTARMEPAGAASFAVQALAAIMREIDKATGYSPNNSLLDEAFTTVGASLATADAAAVIDQIVTKLTRPRAKPSNGIAMPNMPRLFAGRGSLALSFGALVLRLSPAEAPPSGGSPTRLRRHLPTRRVTLPFLQLS